VPAGKKFAAEIPKPQKAVPFDPVFVEVLHAKAHGLGAHIPYLVEPPVIAGKRTGSGKGGVFAGYLKFL
jgi:hypothetical protein